jgi:hypothetical protein
MHLFTYITPPCADKLQRFDWVLLMPTMES